MQKLVRGRGKSVSGIKSLFKTNPSLPMVRDVDIEATLKSDAERLHIGIVDDMGHLHFKRYIKSMKRPPGPVRTGECRPPR